MPRLGGEFKQNPSSIEFSLRRGSLAWARHAFVQDKASRLSEILKQKLPTLSSSRLGKANSPKRDGLSPKTKTPRPREMLEQT